MRFANLDGRAVVVSGEDVCIDLEEASAGQYSSDPQRVYEKLDAIVEWVTAQPSLPTRPLVLAKLGPPAPSPRQVVAVGFNYDDHVNETGFERPPDLPPVFTKFVSSFTGPFSTVALPDGGETDWEVELVVIIGRQARDVTEDEAWSHVAALTVGQDLSERASQLHNQGSFPQFSLGKSFPGFAPMGPWAVTVDEFTDPTDLQMTCTIDGEVVQDGRTTSMIFPVSALISRLSQQLTLYPGDVLFTGTPAGVGMGHKPPRYLSSGEMLTSWIEGIGSIEQQLT